MEVLYSKNLIGVGAPSNELENCHTYQWRARAVNSDGKGPYSQPVKFFTDHYWTDNKCKKTLNVDPSEWPPLVIPKNDLACREAAGILVDNALVGNIYQLRALSQDRTHGQIAGSNWGILCWIPIEPEWAQIFLNKQEILPKDLPEGAVPIQPYPLTKLDADLITPPPPISVDPSCHLTALANLFCRPGPGYEPIDEFTPGITAEVTGLSNDGTHLQVIGPNTGRECTVPNNPKYITLEGGGCDTLPGFELLFAATATPDSSAPRLTQCNDRIDNDNDSLIDLDDRECRNAEDNDESR